jgi:hypothetical protein
VIWDGRDGWAIIDWQTDESFSGRPVWKALWLGKKPEDQTPQEIVRALKSLTDFASASAT